MKIWERFPKKVRVIFGSIILLLIIFYGFRIYAYHYALSENGSEILLRHVNSLSFAVEFPSFFLIPVVFIVSLLSLISRQTRKTYFPIAVCCFLLLIFWFFSPVSTIRIGDRIRMDALKKLEKRSHALVNTVKEYNTKYGYPPESLGKLVPEFLDKVPKTGIGSFPDYKYITGEEADSDYYKGNPWAISVFIPALIVNGRFDFMYLPKQNYPQGGERVGDWACVYSKGCFIATAAFGTPMAKQVDILRKFRDRYLLTNSAGRQFVTYYYQNGPIFADYIKTKPVIRGMVRIALYPLIALAFLLIKGILPYIVVVGCCIVLLRMRSKSPSPLVQKG